MAQCVATIELVPVRNEFDENSAPELVSLLFKKSFRLKVEATHLRTTRYGGQALKRKRAATP